MTSEQFRQARLAMGLTQASLAKLMGMPRPNIARIETGPRQPTKQQAAHIKALMLLHENNLIDVLLSH